MAETFFQEPRVEKIRDTEVKVLPLAVKHISKAAKAAAPIMALLASGNVNAADVLENADSVITLVALATNQSEEFVGELNIAELTVLLTLVIEVNASFFVSQALPKIQEMLKEVGQIAQTTQTVVTSGKKA